MPAVIIFKFNASFSHKKRLVFSRALGGSCYAVNIRFIINLRSRVHKYV